MLEIFEKPLRPFSPVDRANAARCVHWRQPPAQATLLKTGGRRSSPRARYKRADA